MSTFNIPNTLTILRILAAHFFLVFALLDRWQIAFPIFCFAAITDLLDGALARLLSQRTRLGAFLDPMADKLLMFYSVLTLTLSGYLPYWLGGIIFARDLMIVYGIWRMKQRKLVIEYRPTYLSKVTTTFQAVALYAALLMTQNLSLLAAYGVPATEALRNSFLPLAIATFCLTLVTGVQYYRIGYRILYGQSETP